MGIVMPKSTLMSFILLFGSGDERITVPCTSTEYDLSARNNPSCNKMKNHSRSYFLHEKL